MKYLSPQFNLDAFFKHLRRAPAKILLLDYDGTLAPFRENRFEAVPYDGVREVLNELIASGGTRTILISGRMVQEVLALAGLDHPVEVWGTHGWERQSGNGKYEVLPLPREAQSALTGAELSAAEVLDAGRIERKPASVAVHVRGLPDVEGEKALNAIRTAWEPTAESAGLVVKAFDGGLEVHVPGRTKGDAVTDILSTVSEEAAVAFLGDDYTDEDAFQALEGRGARVLVREQFRPTAADVWIQPPEELLSFLRQWSNSVVT